MIDSTLRELNETVSIVAFGLVCWSMILSAGRQKLPKRFLILSLYPIIGFYGNFQANINRTPVTPATYLYLVINILVAAVCFSIIISKPPTDNLER